MIDNWLAVKSVAVADVLLSRQNALLLSRIVRFVLFDLCQPVWMAHLSGAVVMTSVAMFATHLV